jgi:hypothetical protein
VLLRHGAGDSCDAFNLGAGVFPRVRGIVISLGFRAKVCAATILAQDNKVGILNDLTLKRGEVEEGARVEGAWPNVGEGVEVLTELEEAGLGVWVGCAPVRRSMSVTAARRKCPVVSQLERIDAAYHFGPPTLPKKTASTSFAF